MLAFSDFCCDDQDKLGAMLEIHSRCAGRMITIEDLVAGWAAFVDELQAGREFSLSEYREGLAVRGILEELGECLSEHGRQTLVRALLAPDRLFVNLTIRVEGTLSSAWWNRYPKSMVHNSQGSAIPMSSHTMRSRSRFVQAG